MISKEVPQMTFPIVLCHGVCRFDQYWSQALDLDNNDNAERDLLHYFKHNGVQNFKEKIVILWG